ncbi:hypothetical protein rpr22_0350 [Rickettsia prowazekii str. Rp22]|uniref:Uncharacterized protein n=1 Tax=Rickettsia prowazekii (strain Rp22) TaxID=449216 RepID=D5AWR4_RICPP|nr:hypothetical protein rpr22_0350 [Rickettsia prowazekii str. Rp22]
MLFYNKSIMLILFSQVSRFLKCFLNAISDVCTFIVLYICHNLLNTN